LGGESRLAVEAGDFKKYEMNIEDKREVEAIVSHAIKKAIESTLPNSSYIGKILQAVIIAGIIGLFVQFQEVKEATNISKSERDNFKEDIMELKTEVRSLRYIIYKYEGDQERSDQR